MKKIIIVKNLKKIKIVIKKEKKKKMKKIKKIKKIIIKKRKTKKIMIMKIMKTMKKIMKIVKVNQNLYLLRIMLFKMQSNYQIMMKIIFLKIKRKILMIIKKKYIY